MKSRILQKLVSAISILLLLQSCQPSTTTTKPSIALICTPFTNITITRADGTVYSNSTLDSAIVGKKIITVSVNANKPVMVTTIVISWWKAGDRAHNESVQYQMNQQLTANSQSTANIELPRSEFLRQCDGIYFMVSVNYKEQDGTAAVYVEQPRGFLLTKNYLADGTIQAVSCTNTLPASDQ